LYNNVLIYVSIFVQEYLIKKATLYTPLLIVREIFIHQLESMINPTSNSHFEKNKVLAPILEFKI